MIEYRREISLEDLLDAEMLNRMTELEGRSDFNDITCIQFCSLFLRFWFNPISLDEVRPILPGIVIPRSGRYRLGHIVNSFEFYEAKPEEVQSQMIVSCFGMKIMHSFVPVLDICFGIHKFAGDNRIHIYDNDEYISSLDDQPHEHTLYHCVRWNYDLNRE